MNKIFTGLLVIVAAFIVGRVTAPQDKKPVDLTAVDLESKCVIKTVAHLDLSTKENLRLLWTDESADVAYYLVEDTTDLVAEGDRVEFTNGASGIVIGTDVTGFSVNLDSSDNLIASNSGTAVYCDNKQVGYVSRWSTGNVVCIWI